jgi:ubiquinone/menaquinone biosynthesis C-methylase UbiE
LRNTESARGGSVTSCEGMTVLEPGPGMGFFTVELARLVGTSGRVIAVDIQLKMIEGLKRRLAKAGLLGRVEVRLAQPNSMCLADLAGTVDFALAFAVVHEFPVGHSFFSEAAQVLKANACLLLVEPRGHVSAAQFEAELAESAKAGLSLLECPSIRRSQAALLKKK